MLNIYVTPVLQVIYTQSYQTDILNNYKFLHQDPPDINISEHHLLATLFVSLYMFISPSVIDTTR